MANDVTIHVNYRDLDNAFESARELHELLRTMGRANYRINFDYHQLQEAINLLQQANTQLQNLVNQTGQQGQNNLLTQTAQNIEGITRNIRDENNAWRQLEEQRRQQHEAEMRRQQEEQQHLQTTLDLINGIAHAIEGIGSISNATSTFANGLGNAFSSMAGIFETDVARYATASLTHQFMRNLVGSIPNVTGRYDILRTFVPYMQLTGVDSGTATLAQERINQSILGLPIGLDEATQRLRRYYMYTGDLERATNLTIGVQNAITAGGSSQSYKTQAYNMMERMLATGDLTNIRQWQALLVGLGVSQSFIEQELGLDRGTLMASIREGTIGVEDFLGAIERLGTGATAAAVQMNSALDIYKTTLESWISNIQFAVTRGNERVLGALNDTLEAVSGKGLTGYMSDYRDFLNDIFKGTAEFISANPELVSNFLHDAKSMFDAISSISASNVAKLVAGRITELVESTVYLLDKIPEDRLESFIAFATTVAGPLGKLFDAVSGAPYLIAVFDRFEKFPWKTLIDAIARNVDNLARFFETLLNLFTDQQLADIIAFGLTYGKPLAAVLTTIGHSLSTIGVFFAMGGGPRIIAVFDALTAFFTNLAGALAPLMMVVGAQAVVMGSEDAIFRAIRERYLADFASSYSGSDMDLLSAFGSERERLNSGWRRFLGIGSLEYDALLQLIESRGLTGAAYGSSAYHGNVYGTAHGGGGGTFTVVGNKIKSALSGVDIETGNILTVTEALALEIYEVEKAYQDLYDSARESIEGQISLWEKISLNDNVHYVAEGKGNSKANMEYNTDVVERYADAVEFISGYVEEHPEAAGYIGQMVGTMDIADLATIENLVAYIQAGKDLPIDAWNALEEAIDRASEALRRWKQLNGTTEYTYDEASGIIREIFGDDPDVLASFNEIWGNLEKTTESGMKVFKQTLFKSLVEAGKITQEEVDKINATFNDLGVDPDILFATAADMMDALRRGIISVGDKAVWEARRIAYNILHAFDGLTYQIDQSTAEGMDRVVNGGGWSHGGLIYAANGRLIAFEPRGTDTVPAMLTPGEFVMRKQAVDTFGAAFMKSINDLNIGAAFDRLINTKLSNPRGFVNNTYNNRDDHSTHIQNIKTNNPYFASRRAGRFVRAMA